MEKAKFAREISASKFIARALSFYFENNFSFALWRLPNSSAIHLVASDEPREISLATLDDLSPGFMFAPFQPSGKKIHLPADEFFTFESGRVVSASGYHADEILSAQVGAIEISDKQPRYFAPSSPASNSIGQAEYMELVGKCRDEILRGNFEKIVPSRQKQISLPHSFDFLEAFEELCQRYPQAMVSVFSSHLTGTWMGATPEMLVSVTKDQHFHTAAVAGTQPFVEGTDLRSVTWTQKDIEEQALVERYVISCFKRIRLREFEEHGPKTAIAGNVLHLKTLFEVDMVATNFPQLGSTMLQLLHPTSAVCGMPMKSSMKFLEEQEGYDRQYYSGYLGPVNVQQESHLYVNLRCMQLFPRDAILYAGAGVMAESDPQREWAETEMKMHTLGAIIRK